MKEIEITAWMRAVAVEEEDCYVVTFYEMMGGRWVMLGMPERWEKKTFEEEYCDD